MNIARYIGYITIGLLGVDLWVIPVYNGGNVGGTDIIGGAKFGGVDIIVGGKVGGADIIGGGKVGGADIIVGGKVGGCRHYSRKIYLYILLKIIINNYS